MLDKRESAPPTLGSPDAYRRNALIAIPFLLLVPLSFALWFHLWGIALSWPAIGAGALGWVVALFLRTPVALIARRLLGTPERAQPSVTAASGPAEESLRLVTLLLVGRAFPLALSVGLGWTTVEIVYAIVNGLAIASLLRRTDERARQARAFLASIGLERLLSQTDPAFGVVTLGVIERFSVSALHIGFTLLIAWQPLLVLGTIPVHSATNFVWLRLFRRSAVLSEVAVALIGAAILIAGLAAFARL
jgi:hypothetical protein